MIRALRALWFAIWFLLCGCTYSGVVIDRYIEPAGFDSYVTATDGIIWFEHDERYWIKVQMPHHKRWFTVPRIEYGRLRIGDRFNSEGINWYD